MLKREASNIERIMLEDLTPNKRNARRHSERQVKQLANSMTEFGFTTALVIDERNMILAGEGRFLAAKKLGLAYVPCVRMTGLTENEKRLYTLSDNKIALNSSWDNGVLAIELKELMSTEMTIELTGFDMPEIDILIGNSDKADPKSKADGVDHVPSVEANEQAITRIGDLWLLGRHRLTCGTALDEAVLELLMGGEQAAMMFTDPPYNVPIAGFVSGRGKAKHREFAQASGELDVGDFTGFLETAFRIAQRHLIDGAIAFTCMDWRHMREVLTAGYSVFAEQKQLCVWNKQTAGMGTFYRSQHELIPAWKKGSAPHRNNFGLGDKGRHRTNVWNYPGLNGFTKGRDEQLALHATVKPVAMVSDAILDVSNRGEIVLDPFGGSGTTLIAAQQTGRAARLVEIDPLYCDVIVRRWEKLTGEAATLSGSGHTLEQAKRARFGWGTRIMESAHG